MTKYSSRKVMNFRHLLGCDTIVDLTSCTLPHFLYISFSCQSFMVKVGSGFCQLFDVFLLSMCDFILAGFLPGIFFRVHNLLLCQFFCCFRTKFKMEEKSLRGRGTAWGGKSQLGKQLVEPVYNLFCLRHSNTTFLVFIPLHIAGRRAEVMKDIVFIFA